MPSINEILQGRYRIVSQMGQNGTGPIYQAFDENLNADVVLREIPVKLGKVTTPAQMESMRAAFTGEAEILGGITHELFIRIRDYFTELDGHYLVMESVEGDYLNRLLEEKGQAFSVTDVAAWADRLLDGLNYLHTQAPPLIHGDIKPQNIKLSSDGKVKLLALGVARNQQKGSTITEQAFDATALHYLPLEQIWGNLDRASQKVISNSYDEASEELLMQPADARSDIYALGATLYHLLTGQRPIDALERSIDILEGKADPLPTPTKLNPNVPPEISYVLMKALEIKREKRFESVLMMRQVLKTVSLRAKEREAQEAQDVKKQTLIAAPEIRLPEPKQLKIGQPASAQKETEVEADPQKQLEMIKARLLEAENRRQLAEQRAADAERRLQEKEISISKAPEEASVLDIPDAPAGATALRAVEDDFAQVLEMPEAPEKPAPIARPSFAARQTSQKTQASQTSPASGGFASFEMQAKQKRSSIPMLAAAAVILIAGAAGFGIWSFMSAGPSGAGKPEQTISTPVTSLSEQAKPESAADTASSSSENAAQPGVTDAQENTGAPASATTAANPQSVKTKPAAQPTKPPIAAKSPAKQKKALTVDDLINDN
jgi:serine/threonine protein kinase